MAIDVEVTVPTTGGEVSSDWTYGKALPGDIIVAARMSRTRNSEAWYLNFQTDVAETTDTIEVRPTPHRFQTVGAFVQTYNLTPLIDAASQEALQAFGRADVTLQLRHNPELGQYLRVEVGVGSLSREDFRARHRTFDRAIAALSPTLPFRRVVISIRRSGNAA